MNDTPSRPKYDSRLSFGQLLIFLAVLAGLVVLLLFLHMRRQEQTYALDQPYDLQVQNGAERLSSFSQQTAEAFASGLITLEGDVTIRGFSLPQEDCKALLFDLENTEAVFARNAYQKVYPASLAKIMTALLAMEHSTMSEMVTMQEEDFLLDEGAQVSSLETGDQLSMDKLFHLLVIYSANDAAMAIARTIGGDIPTFVDMMNAKAEELGMTGTHFTNPTGLHQEQMVTTPYDVYLMMREAYSHQMYLNVSQMAEYTTEVQSANGLSRTIYHASTDEYLTKDRTLPSGIRILASKTGTTDQAGSCLALVVQNAYGVPYLALVMGAWNKDLLYGNMSALLSLT